MYHHAIYPVSLNLQKHGDTLMSKALGLLSGGLDSSLAAMCLKRQGIEVTAIVFVTPFFGSNKAERMTSQLDIPLIVEDISKIHLDMVKKPHYGYGKNLNPCIDCHAMMFRLAGEFMAERGFDFLFSGEVLGQRPMSQNADALRKVANYSGHPDRILDYGSFRTGIRSQNMRDGSQHRRDRHQENVQGHRGRGERPDHVHRRALEDQP